MQIEGRMTQLEVGDNGDVYAVDISGKLYYREGVSSTNLYGTEWKLLREASSVTTGWSGQYLLHDGRVYRSSGNVSDCNSSCHYIILFLFVISVL